MNMRYLQEENTSLREQVRNPKPQTLTLKTINLQTLNPKSSTLNPISCNLNKKPEPSDPATC